MQYYLCKLVGTGSGEDSVRPKIDNYTEAWSKVADSRLDLRTTEGYMIVLADVLPGEQSAVASDADITLIGDRNGIAQGALAKVFAKTGEIENLVTGNMEEALQKIGARFHARRTFA